ncbi:quaternary amine ABC transporter ATP-binding protein [Granulicoccus phenolivorans]|uniref:quaternary amine ABC transporter ATP-binding protein n=1 Tax=Granulicoccus phenolivorans TaxID=266854 RepID=UPI0003FAC9A3|nr:betaine/proline/choline family ABC transporter ATP-binding protein [Granulicoccus phenolivorans]
MQQGDGDASMPETSAVRAEHLYKVFTRNERALRTRFAETPVIDAETLPGTAAVIDANFEIAHGETFVVMGLSGSGKSTLIRMLNGLNEPTGGTVEINGRRLTGAPAETVRAIRRDEISMVFQHFGLLPHRTVLDNIAYGLEVRNVPRAERTEQAAYWLERVGLSGHGTKYPHMLSGGQQQRVGLARALTAQTPILLMDEAFSALDPIIRGDLQEMLLELQAELGKTIVFITHDLSEAMKLGDRIAIMRQGRIDQIGTATQILTQPANSYVARFTHDIDRSRVLTAGMVARPTATRPTGDPVPRSTPIGDLFGRVLASPQPLGVVDRQQNFLGVIDADVLMAAMAGVDRPGAGAHRTEVPA